MEQYEKKEYTKPELIVHGDVDDITKGNSTGSRLDASFPSGTDKGDLTFSGSGDCFC